jgi:hypothetical protein
MFGKYNSRRKNMNEIDSRDKSKQQYEDAQCLNERVGNAPRNSQKLNIGDHVEELDVVENDDFQRQYLEMVSDRKSRLVNERAEKMKDNLTERDSSELHRKPSYQVISNDLEDMKFEDAIGFIQQNRISTRRGDQTIPGSVSSDSGGSLRGSGPCRNSVGRRRSVDLDDDDDEKAAEIKELMKEMTVTSTEGSRMLAEHQKRQGAMHRHYTESNSTGADSRRRRSFKLGSDDEEAEEIKELMRNETLSSVEGRKRLQDLQSLRIPNHGGSLTNQPMNSPHSFAPDGLPENWSRDSVMSPSVFRLVPLSGGDRECEQIYSEMEQAGLDVVRVERLQNVDLLEKFKSEMNHMARRKKTGK